jgi:hypothetical protein
MFSSKAQKQEKDYIYLSQILKSSGFDTADKVNAHLRKVFKRARYASLLIIIVFGVICLLTPNYLPIWIILGGLCVIWAWASAVSAKRIMTRYIEEEINNAQRENNE